MTTYSSTRGASPELSFADVLLTGLAPDGGLYVPSEWPGIIDVSADLPYAEFAAEVMWPFVSGSIERSDFEAICVDAYATFSDPDVIPIRTLASGIQLVELFHGPTLAFKDVAMQMLGRLFDHELNQRGTRTTIVGATSGDTGSAAIEAFRDRKNVDIFILHPHERTSQVQRRQMTTVDAPNVYNIAIEGTFDDCQDIVKAMFADVPFRERVQLGAVNSINWARVMAQVVYYHWALAKTAPARADGAGVSVTVPTGNFGNVFAGRVAQRTGAGIDHFIVASNRNDILTQFFTSGSMTIGEVEPSLSPSMDIQVSSNLERLIYELLDDNGTRVSEMMQGFRAQGEVAFASDVSDRLAAGWSGQSLTDDETLDVILDVYDKDGVLLDPHTAVGVGAAERAMASGDHSATPHAAHQHPSHQHIVMATAHPAKFPDAVEKATGIRPPLPKDLADLYERTEKFEVLPNDLLTVQEFVEAQ